MHRQRHGLLRMQANCNALGTSFVKGNKWVLWRQWRQRKLQLLCQRYSCSYSFSFFLPNTCVQRTQWETSVCVFSFACPLTTVVCSWTPCVTQRNCSMTINFFGSMFRFQRSLRRQGRNEKQTIMTQSSYSGENIAAFTFVIACQCQVMWEARSRRRREMDACRRSVSGCLPHYTQKSLVFIMYSL